MKRLALVGALVIGVMFTLLAVGAVSLRHDADSSLEPAETLTAFAYELADGTSGEAAFPYVFRGLPPHARVTLVSSVEPGRFESLLVKTVYAGVRLYADDVLIYEAGAPGSYPQWLLDPPTLIGVVSLPSEASLLRFEYVSPSQRDSLSVPELVVGSHAAVRDWLFQRDAALLFIAALLVVVGATITALAVLFRRDRPVGTSFFHAGFFALAAGCWGFGECNLTALLIPAPALLYVLAFGGLFVVVIPLLRFGLVVLRPRHPLPLQLAAGVLMTAAGTAFVLQLLGLRALASSLFLLQILDVGALLVLSGVAMSEYVRYRNRAGRWFALPAFVLFVAALLEYINYLVGFTRQLSLFFMSGALVFTLMLGVIAVWHVREVTREAEEKRRVLAENAALERMNLLKEQVMSTISHEARTPLAVLASYAGLVSMELRSRPGLAQDAGVAADLDTIVFEAKRVASLIDSMKQLTLSRQSDATRAPLDLAAVVRQTTRLYEPILVREGVALVLDLPDGLPPVLADPEGVTQVLFNLLQNARRHTRDGEVEIGIRRVAGIALRVSVRDTGSGVRGEVLPRAFERGVSGDAGGSGLGLAVSKEIIDANGGEIGLENNPDAGATAWFTLPIVERTVPDAA